MKCSPMEFGKSILAALRHIIGTVLPFPAFVSHAILRIPNVFTDTLPFDPYTKHPVLIQIFFLMFLQISFPALPFGDLRLCLRNGLSDNIRKFHGPALAGPFYYKTFPSFISYPLKGEHLWQNTSGMDYAC